MPQNVTWNGVTYPIPLAGELNWAALSNFLIALGTDAAVDQESKQAIRLALTTPVSVNAATDYTVLSALTVPSAVAINLPAGVDKQLFILGDGTGDASTNNITITPNGAETINGLANLVLTHDRECCLLQYHAGTTDWKILSRSILPGTLTFNDIAGVLQPAKGGTGVANPAAATLTRVGNFDLQFTLSAATALTLPTTGSVMTADSTDTMTNKTYDADGAGNNLSNIDDGNIKVGANIARNKTASGTADYVVINDGTGVLSEEQYLNKTRGGTGITSTATFPASGVVVTEAASETLTNKRYEGGTASAGDVHILSEDTLANLTALPRVQGALYYDTTNNVVVYDDGAALVAFSSQVVATPAQAGIVSTVQQSFGGLKKFESGMIDVADSEVTILGGSVTLTDADRRTYIIVAGSQADVTLPTTGVKKGEIWTFHNNNVNPVYLYASDSTILDSPTLITGNGSVSSGKLEQRGKIVLSPVIDTPVTATDWRVLEVIEEGTWTGITFSGVFTQFSPFRYSRVNQLVSFSTRADTSSISANTNGNGNFDVPHATVWVGLTEAVGTGIAYGSSIALSNNVKIHAVQPVAANTIQCVVANANGSADSFNVSITGQYELVGY